MTNVTPKVDSGRWSPDDRLMQVINLVSAIARSQSTTGTYSHLLVFIE